MKGEHLKRLLTFSRWVFGPAAIVFLLVAGWRARNFFWTVLEQTAPAPLVITISLWALLHLLSPVFTRIVLREVGAAVPYRVALGIHVGRLPARYLPGGIWHTVSRVMDLNRLGVSRAHLSTMVLLENVVPVAVALLLGGLCVLVAGGTGILALASGLSGLVLLALPPLVLRHRLLLQGARFGLVSYFKAVAVSAAFWTIAATAFACYWSAFPSAKADTPILEIYGAYLLAWAAGFVSVFAPQGIGVFESVAGSLLKGALPFAGVAVLAAGFRVATMVADMLAYATLHAVRFRSRMPTTG